MYSSETIGFQETIYTKHVTNVFLSEPEAGMENVLKCFFFPFSLYKYQIAHIRLTF